jgi:hypothetical protein
VPGKLEQTDIAAKRQRVRELGISSRSNEYSIKSAINALEGVAGVRFLENNESTTEVIQNVTLLPHSTWVCVDGGVDSEIAEAYVVARTGGSNFNGAVTVPYQADGSDQVISVKFDRPTDKPLICRITVKLGNNLSSIDDIKQAAVDYANGLVEGELGFHLGEDSSPFELAAGVNAALSDVFVAKCELATVADGSGSYSTDTIENELYEKASLITSNVQVVTS